MKLSKISLSIFCMSSLMLSMVGCGNKSKKTDPKVNTTAGAPLESNKSEIKSDYANVLQTESSLEAVGYKFKYDATTKQVAWDGEFREVYLKSLVDVPSVTDVIAVLENHETVLLNFVQKYKSSKGVEDFTIQECEVKAQLVRQTIETLKVDQSKEENKPKEKVEEKTEDKGSKKDKKKEETVKPSDSSTKKPVPVPKKKPKI